MYIYIYIHTYIYIYTYIHFHVQRMAAVSTSPRRHVATCPGGEAQVPSARDFLRGISEAPRRPATGPQGTDLFGPSHVEMQMVQEVTTEVKKVCMYVIYIYMYT